MSSRFVLNAILKAFEGIHPKKSITLDNSSEFTLFRKFERALDTTVYFADLHSPWQRGSNERINGAALLLPMRGDFTSRSDAELDRVVGLINERPRLCLDLCTPANFFVALNLTV